MVNRLSTALERYSRHPERQTASRLVRHAAGALALTVCLLAPAHAQFIQQGSKIVPADEAGKCIATATPPPCAAFGWSSALSSDGNTALIGGLQDDNGIGAAWVYVRNTTTNRWSEQAKLVGTGNPANSFQGVSVALSADGNTALVGGYVDNLYTGAVWVFTRSGTTWTQQGSKLTANNEIGQGRFGWSVSVSSDGNTAVIGGPTDNATGANPGVGAAWIFQRSGSTWSQVTKLIGTGYTGLPAQGSSVALSGDGLTAIVGGSADNNKAGAVWIFTNNNGSWSQQGNKIVAPDAVGAAGQGNSVSISSDGNTAAFGGVYDNNNAGAVWVYTRSGSAWTEKQKLVGTGASGEAAQGTSVALSADALSLLEGGYTDNNSAGAAWRFVLAGGTWTQQGTKLVGNNAVNPAYQGVSVALDNHGDTGVVGGPADNNSMGAAWIYSSNVIQPTNPLGFFPVTPCRAVDTRPSQGKTGAFGPPALAPYTGRNFPATAQAYSLNFTVVPPGILDFLSAWPSNQPFPGVSTLNSPDGSVIANAAIVPDDPSGNIEVTAGESTDLIIDGNGYFAPPNGSELAFYPMTPCRVVDTRDANKPAGFGPPSLGTSGRVFAMYSSGCNIPNDARAYALNLTVVPKGPLSFLSIWPADKAFPNVSTLNSNDGSILANAAIVPAAANGSVEVTAGNPTDFIMDINGYFAAPGNPGALHFYPVVPCRVADTRASQGFGGAFGPPSLTAYQGRVFPMQQSACGIPSAAKAYSLNITVVPQGPLSFLSAWPSDKPFPNVSTLNSPKGLAIANAAIVPAAADGSIEVTAGNPTDVIIDINGYFAP